MASLEELARMTFPEIRRIGKWQEWHPKDAELTAKSEEYCKRYRKVAGAIESGLPVSGRTLGIAGIERITPKREQPGKGLEWTYFSAVEIGGSPDLLLYFQIVNKLDGGLYARRGENGFPTILCDNKMVARVSPGENGNHHLKIYHEKYFGRIFVDYKAMHVPLWYTLIDKKSQSS